MKELVFGLIIMGLGKCVFEWMNMTNITTTGLKALTIRSFKLLPLQLVGFVGFSYGLSRFYTAIGHRIWLLLIIEEASNYAVKIGVRGQLFKQPIGPGTLVGLGLAILAAVIAGIWR